MDDPAANRPTISEGQIRALITEHSAAVSAYAARLTSDRHAAENVVHETMPRAWRRPERLPDGPAATRRWLLRLARNIVFDRTRATDGARRSATQSCWTRSRCPIRPITCSTRSSRPAASTASAPRTGQVYLDELSVNEAARRLGVPTGTVKSRCYDTLPALRRALEVEGTSTFALTRCEPTPLHPTPDQEGITALAS